MTKPFLWCKLRQKPREGNSEKQMNKKEWFRALKFTLFSVSAGIIQILVDTLLLEVFGFGEKGLAWLAYLVALVASVVWNFTFNRKFTFKSANNVPVAMLKVACYYLVFTPLSTWWTDYFVETLYVNEYIVLAVTMVINFVTEFLYDKFVVFRGSEDTNDLAKKQAEQQKQQCTAVAATVKKQVACTTAQSSENTLKETAMQVESSEKDD